MDLPTRDPSLNKHMKLEIIKGLAILKATNKKDSEKLMLYYLGKTPATKEVVEAPKVQEKRPYTHSESYLKSKAQKARFAKAPRKSCEYGCGEYKNLAAHMLQKHGEGKNGPQTPARYKSKNAGTSTPARREYLTLPELPHLSGGL